ncbi:MAG: tRNA (adenosine(37)-N6)-methyltransferase TrmM, partial [Bacteroidetes bacterium]
MLAQRGLARVDAIDIAPEAVEQAERNVAHSPWPGAVEVHHSSFQLWAEACPSPYELVVSNPPYFSNSLKGPDERRNAMRHNDLLPHDELLEALDLCLSPDGVFAGIFPTSEGALFIARAAQLGFYCRRQLLVSAKPNGPVKRMLCELSRGSGAGVEEQMSIYDHSGEYARGYRELTGDFYLNF